MVKENINNDYWICRTVMGTIALEEEISNKTRNFLYQIVTPKKISEVFKALNTSMPMDFYDMSDFYKELNHCMSQFWIEKVEEPQEVNREDISIDDIDIPDTWGVFEVSKNIKDKSKSEISETMFDDFGNPLATASDLKYWLEKENQEQKETGIDKVEFKEEHKDREFNYGLLTDIKILEDQIPEFPEENPFYRKVNNTFHIENEFDVPVNDEAKKMLAMFEGVTMDDFKGDANKDVSHEFFSQNVPEKAIEKPKIEVGKDKEIPARSVAPKKQEVNKDIKTSPKIQSRQPSKKKVVKKKTFFQKIMSFFGK